MTLPYQLDRIITIDAPRELVFSFFTDNSRWASWWGKGSTIDPRPGGRVHIVHPNNIEVVGDVLEIQPPESISFTYGYAAGQAIPPGGSRVTIRLEDQKTSTRVHLTHEFSDAAQRDHHVQGWRFQLSLFSNAVHGVLHTGLDGKVDRWFAMWSDADPASRRRTLEELATTSVTFKDRFSALEGAGDLTAHIAAAQQFMPGMTIRRRGAARHCQGVVLADWDATGPGGSSRGSGSNVFTLGSDGRITGVTGLWS